MNRNFSSLLQFLLKLRHAGLEFVVDETERRKIKLTNMGVFISLASFFCFEFIYLLIGGDFYNANLICLPFFAFFPLVWWMHSIGWMLFPRYYIMFLAYFSVGSLIVGGQGTSYDIHYYYILFAMIPIVIFSNKQNLARYIFTFLSILFFIVLEFTDYNPTNLYSFGANFDSKYLNLFYMLNAFSATFYLIAYTENAAVKVEKELIQERDRARADALTDTLTGLGNRRHFNSIVDFEFAQSMRHNLSCAVAICDIDFFKQYNDHFGHLQGDQCLKQVALALKRSLKRRSDVVCRYGGEEFAMILPGLRPEDAPALLDHVMSEISRLEIEHPYGVDAKLSISMGVTFTPQAGDHSFVEVLERADLALYAAKGNGRKQYLIA